MNFSPDSVSRRHWLATSSAGLLSTLAMGKEPAPAKEDGSVSFFLIGDTHYLAAKAKPEQLDPISEEMTGRLIDTLNRLPGTEIPKEAGGGKVQNPRGVIHAGDLIHNGPQVGKEWEAVIKTEWAGYEAGFGLTGKEGKLKYPVYEVHGNHDSTNGKGLLIDKLIERNTKRTGVTNLSKNGLHYSWDWGPIHFVNLGILVGAVEKVARQRRYNSLDSLAFLKSDLETKVGKTGKPVIITHHVDMIRYAQKCDMIESKIPKEWDPCDVQEYYETMQSFNIIGIFYGHTHVRNVYRWQGSTEKAEKGIPVFNVDKASHFSFHEQAFFYFEITEKQMLVREYVSPDRWQTAKWTPQVWKIDLPLKKD